MTDGDGGTLELEDGRERGYAAAALAARSLGIEHWQATVIANAVIDAMTAPKAPHRVDA